jgi:hypothetical protein
MSRSPWEFIETVYTARSFVISLFHLSREMLQAEAEPEDLSRGAICFYHGDGVYLSI